MEKLSKFQPVSEHFDVSTLEDALRNNKEILATGFFLLRQGMNSEISIRSLENIGELNDSNISSTTFGFLDPSSIEDPGWVLRNYVTFLVRKL